MLWETKLWGYILENGQDYQSNFTEVQSSVKPYIDHCCAQENIVQDICRQTGDNCLQADRELNPTY